MASTIIRFEGETKAKLDALCLIHETSMQKEVIRIIQDEAEREKEKIAPIVETLLQNRIKKETQEIN